MPSTFCAWQVEKEDIIKEKIHERRMLIRILFRIIFDFIIVE
jgi:hypothetical protein